MASEQSSTATAGAPPPPAQTAAAVASPMQGEKPMDSIPAAGPATIVGTTNQSGSIPTAVPVIVKRYLPSTLPQETHPGPRAQFLVGEDPAIKEQQEKAGKSFGFGLMFIRMGSLDLNGPMVVPKSMNVVTICHGSNIDLSQGIFVHPVSTINVFSVCGGFRVTIPRGVRVEAKGLAICGGIRGLDDYGRAANNAVMESPLVVIEGFTLCGGAAADLNLAVEALVIVRHEEQLSNV